MNSSTIAAWSSDCLHRLSVEVTNGKIASVDRQAARCDSEDSATFLCPGFIDIQVNGWGGISFSDPGLTTGQIELVTARMWENGVAMYFPTLITDAYENLKHGVSAIARACREGRVGKSILGIHLEGPYLSAQEGPRGAHPLEHVRKPDWDEFRGLQDAAQGLIRLVTLAPELQGAIPFIGRLVSAGVRVAIGHTAASTEEIHAAIEAGACLSTHLGNAAHDRLQRHSNYVYDQLAADELWASLISDGHHLPPGLVKIFVRAKGPERIILVSDAAYWAGLPAGVYRWGNSNVEVRQDGWIGVVDAPRLAGSGLLLNRGIENVTRFAGVSFHDAIRMVTTNPAQMVGVASRVGSIATGYDATFTLVDWNESAHRLKVRRTIVEGEVVFSSENPEGA